MSEEQKKVVNPLLNASVVGATLEDFNQHAILVPVPPAPTPAAETTPTDVPTTLVIQRPLQTVTSPVAHPFTQTIISDDPTSLDLSQIRRTNPLELDYFTIPTPPEQQQFAPQPQLGYAQQTELQPPPVLEQQLVPPPKFDEKYGYSTVLSTLSSYFKLGSNSPEPSDVGVTEQAPETTSRGSAYVYPPYFGATEPAVAVPLYKPTELPLLPPRTAAPTESGNNYRRGDLRRPTYAPIPGLSTETIIPHVQPTQPPASIQTSQFYKESSPNLFVPELSGYATPVPEPDVNVVEHQQPPLLRPTAIKPTFDSTNSSKPSSPFLEPLKPGEFEFEDNPPSRPPGIPYHTPAILSPSSYRYEMATADRRSPVTGMFDYSEYERVVVPGTEGVYIYRDVEHHWFYKKVFPDGKFTWIPFTKIDSANLETAFHSDCDDKEYVATDGGRFDVCLEHRVRKSVYWCSYSNEVRRCSWFQKAHTDGRYVPFDEDVAEMLEIEYRLCYETNIWNKKIQMKTGETVVFHSPNVLVVFPHIQTPDAWGHSPTQLRPWVIRRGIDDFPIEDGEPPKIDHLLFLVHGIGSVCDLKFRPVEEVVDDFRKASLQLVQTHYKSSCDKGITSRVEVLPISWHEKLHSEETGIDKTLKGITLESISRLRDFTNDTILDVLFYTSPVYSQTIISSVGDEINRVYDIFKERNPSFKGGVSLGGHSLGSLILFDILCHQHAEIDPKKTEVDPKGAEVDANEAEAVPNGAEAGPSGSRDGERDDVVPPLKPHPEARQMNRRISYMMGATGTGQPQINYPTLRFHPNNFFALGSPIGMFVTVRGLDSLGEHFALPTCPTFFNIFHPYDPVAYRIEALINPELAGVKPMLIPHHKGRKRMHLELKETMARVGADIKQRVIDSMSSTWNTVYQFASFKSQPVDVPKLEEEVDKAFKLQQEEHDRQQIDETVHESETTDLSLGILNGGRRIDYVLQEAPLEFFNDYLFALSSHVCYWESQDTMLLILKEIYNSMEVAPDSQIPQQTMTIERPSSSQRQSNGEDSTINPMFPPRGALGPPPKSGFIRKGH